jgi:hypothetical protein
MLVGIIGKARSGKDTFAIMLAEELYSSLRSKFILMAFAKDLKDRVQQDFDLHYDQLWGDDKEIKDKRYTKPHAENETTQYWTAREILQAYGQFFRTIDYDYWVKNLFRAIDYKEYKNVIITDVRHTNEGDAVVKRYGFLIRITRNTNNNIHGSNHISETAMDDYDKVDFDLTNNGTIDDLRVVAKDTAKLLVATQKIKRVTADINLK